jgi:hypothetical protein
MTTNSNFIRMNHLKTVIEEIMCNPPKALPEKAHKKNYERLTPLLTTSSTAASALVTSCST